MLQRLLIILIIGLHISHSQGSKAMFNILDIASNWLEKHHNSWEENCLTDCTKII